MGFLASGIALALASITVFAAQTYVAWHEPPTHVESGAPAGLCAGLIIATMISGLYWCPLAYS